MSRSDWKKYSTEQKVEALYEELEAFMVRTDDAIGRIAGRIVKLEKASNGKEYKSR